MEPNQLNILFFYAVMTRVAMEAWFEFWGIPRKSQKPNQDK